MTRLAALDGAVARAFVNGPRRTGGLVVLAVAVLGLLLFRLGEAPITRRAEARTFDVASHMVETGDWLVPVRHGQARLRKPPLYYWASAGVSELSGGPSLLTHRLPAALSGFAIVLLVFAWGRSLGGFANGTVAAMCLVSMVQFWSMSRRGVAEMPLALFALLALYLFDRIYWDRRRDLVPAFFAALLLGFLAKATVALLLVGLPIVLRLGLDGRLRRVFARDVMGWGVACALGCVAWYLVILVRVPGAAALLQESLLLPLGLAESVGSAAHVRPPWFFVPALFEAGAPAMLLIALVPVYLRELRGDPNASRATFPLFALAALFVAFSIFPMKQKHYLAPLLPLAALLLAPALRSFYERRRATLEAWARPAGTAAFVAVPVLTSLLGFHLFLVGDYALLLGAVPLLLGVAWVGFVAARRGRLRVLGLSALAATLLVIGLNETSFSPWRSRFYGGTVRESQGFDTARWEQRFEQYPLLRPIYRAGEWSADAPPNGSPRPPVRAASDG